jgi:hypothetical protein
VPPEIEAIAKKCCEDTKEEVAKGKKTKSGKKPSCAAQGNWKHKCCKDALEKKNYSNVTCEGNCGTTKCRLDVAIGGNPITSPGNVTQIYDYKFPCGAKGQSQMSANQKRKYNKNFPKAKKKAVPVQC